VGAIFVSETHFSVFEKFEKVLKNVYLIILHHLLYHYMCLSVCKLTPRTHHNPVYAFRQVDRRPQHQIVTHICLVW